MRKQIELLKRYLMHAKAKSVIGGMLSGVSMMASMVVYQPNEINIMAQEPMGVIGVEISTIDRGPIRTVPNFRGVSQGFRALHPGTDITAVEGSAIYPILPGRVIRISASRFDYGRSVMVEHENGLVSLYAHMGKIMVDEGDEVNEKTQLGEVGLTGKTTGYHLHLEIKKNGVHLDPLRFLSKPRA